MRLFLKRSRGSITVFVALILVPTVFFSGFLVDLARLKLYGNQAVMTADNYGEAVLAQYDNLLKELYGLFAVTQDTDGVKALDELQKYMQSSFDPSEKTISWGHLQPVLGQTEYTGFMPYKDAEVSLEYEFVKKANLGTPEVLSTQIGDFMQFRIAQQLLGNDGSDLLEMVETIQNTENDAKVIDKKLELDKEVEELYGLAGDYYKILKDFAGYPDYIRGINVAYSGCDTQFSDITGSSHYQIYYDYQTADHTAMDAAVKKRERIESGENEDFLGNVEDGNEETAGKETLSEDEKNVLNIHDAYMKEGEARRDALEKKFSAAIDSIISAKDSGTIRFDNFHDRLAELDQKAKAIVSKGTDLSTLVQELRELLKEDNISPELKTEIGEELKTLDNLFGQLENYKKIVDLLAGQDASVNEAYRGQTEQIISRLNEIKGRYLDGDIDNLPDWEDALDESKWEDFKPIGNLYNSLAGCFEPGGEGSEGTEKKKKAEGMLTQAEGEMSKEEETPARDIPESFHYGTSYHSSSFRLSDMVDDAVGAFSANHFKNEMNRLLLKLYTVEYDFGMFSSRVTNISDEEDQKEVSLTGYEKAANINYLYQAELEYILGGSNSSKENLNEARNKILAFRAVVNFTSTYRVKEINDTIKTISKAVPNPILGLVVNGALRLAVAGVETAADWEKLKEGESVFFAKKQMNELSAYDKVKELIDPKPSNSNGGSKSFQMDYSQYLMAMMIFFTSSEEVTQRTANLIELNVNTVQQKIGSSSKLDKLEFQMSNAYTAVNATCKVHLDFVVMPRGFAREMTDDYAELEEFQKNSYQFTVTRGY